MVILSLSEIRHIQEFCSFKGTVHRQIKNTYFFLLPVVLLINLNCFDVSCLVLPDIACGEFCFFSNIKGPNSAWFMVPKLPIKTLFCEQFHVGKKKVPT